MKKILYSRSSNRRTPRQRGRSDCRCNPGCVLELLIEKAIEYTEKMYGDTIYIFVDEKNTENLCSIIPFKIE